MKKILFITCLLLLTFSCRQNENVDNSDASEIEEEVQDVKTGNEKIQTEPQFIENDNLVRHWYEELESISREEDQFSVEKEYRENRHVPERTDTIIHLTYDETQMRIHTTKGLYAVESAEIGNKGFELQDSVEVGMTRDQLEQILGIPLESNHIKVGNKLETYVFNFFIENDTVEKIEFQGYVD